MIKCCGIIVFTVFLILSTKAESQKSVLVSRGDESGSCGTPPGVSLKAASKRLFSKGVKAISFGKAHDGKVYCKACGCPTGMMNVFEIDAKDLKKAEAAGFQKEDRKLNYFNGPLKPNG